MATKNIVPRADNEGGIGRADKRWHSGSFVSGSFGSIESTQFSGSGINITGIITSSYSISSSHAITSSYALSSGGVGGLWTASSGQITRDSDVSITGSLYMKGDIIPDVRFAYDLGSLGKSWRNLFVQHHSIQFVSESNSIASIGATSDGTVTTSGSSFECEGLFNSGSIISTGSINNDGGLTTTTISCSGMFCSGDMTGMSQVTSDTGSFSVIEGNSPLTISSSLLTIKGGVQNLSHCHVSNCITASIFSGSLEGPTSASIASNIATNLSNISTLTTKTGSYASTGSNTYTGTQEITGSLSVSGSVKFPTLQITGSNWAGTATSTGSDTGGGTWHHDTNASGVPNDVYAGTTYQSVHYTPTNHLVLHNYRFTIPSTAIITGFKVDIVRKANTSAGPATNYRVVDYNVSLIKNYTASIESNDTGSNLSGYVDYNNHRAPLTLTVETASFGSPSSSFGQTWTPAEVNDENFGINYQTENGRGVASGFTYGPQVDAIQISCYYYSGFGIATGDPGNFGELFYTSSNAFGGSLDLNVLCISKG